MDRKDISVAAGAAPLEQGHTPLPWFAEARDTGRLWTIKVRAHDGGSGEPVARFVEMNDAAFIVRACNSHAALVKAMESLIEIMEHCSVTNGVCCCGDSIENHASPLACGHSPVDHGQYIADGAYKAARATLALATKEA